MDPQAAIKEPAQQTLEDLVTDAVPQEDRVVILDDPVEGPGVATPLV